MKQGLSRFEFADSPESVLNHRDVDWQRVRRVRYLIHQHLHYDYPGPIYDLEHRLMILPAERHGDQWRSAHCLEVAPSTIALNYQDDAFGNTESQLYTSCIEHTIDFEAWILVERNVEDGPLYLPASNLSAAYLLDPTKLTQPSDELRRMAEQLRAEGESGLALAQRINRLVYATMHYAHDVTHIHTTATEALALRQGVCQDYAHLMLTLCRLCGLPARYVSGHIPGEGGTHAWVEVILPVAERTDVVMAVPFDPTHGCQADLSYITIAIGRDYNDVAPTSGTFRAAYGGQLTVNKSVELLFVEYKDETGSA